MNYLEHQFQDIEYLTEKHNKTLEQRNSQKEFYSELHRLLDTRYIVFHQEFVEFKGSTHYKGMNEKNQEINAKIRKETPDRCKKELDNYEKNRSVDEDLHKALDGLYNSGKLSFGYAFILKCNLIFDWEDSTNLENARQAYKDRKKYK